MEQHATRIGQLRGAVDLAQDAVEATVNAVAEAHQEIARVPYAVLGRIPVVAEPALAIEQIHLALTGSVYAAIHGVNRLTGSAANCLLDQVE